MRIVRINALDTEWGRADAAAFAGAPADAILVPKVNGPADLDGDGDRVIMVDDRGELVDGDELLFVHEGEADLYCDYGHLEIRDGDYVVLPRSTMWRLECEAEMRLLLVEATGGAYQLPDKGMVGPHAVFDPAILDVPAIDDAFAAQQDEKGG